MADYVVCAAEAEALRAVETETARVIAAQDSLVLVLAERSEAAHTEASACALGAEAEHWRAAARSAERRARWWRTVALSAGGITAIIVAAWRLGSKDGEVARVCASSTSRERGLGSTLLHCGTLQHLFPRPPAQRRRLSPSRP